MTNPLVSVIIPTFNAVQTLPVALASLLAQTYQNWECIVVDDGSTDNTAELMLNVINYDKRFKFISLGENFGRAVARQKALDNSHGKYLAMVDADDWIYPSKLEEQVHILETHSNLALVSCGMTIVDFDNKLLGFRLQPNDFVIYEPLNGPQLLSVAHATSMIRLDVANAVGYDKCFSQTEDTDFLLRVLMHNSFAVVGRAYYVYAEDNHSNNMEVIVQSYIDLLNIYYKHLMKFPIQTCMQMGLILFKLISAFAVKVVGYEKKPMNFRKMDIPTEVQINMFNHAYQVVLVEYDKIIERI